MRGFGSLTDPFREAARGQCALGSLDRQESQEGQHQKEPGPHKDPPQCLHGAWMHYASSAKDEGRATRVEHRGQALGKGVQAGRQRGGPII